MATDHDDLVRELHVAMGLPMREQFSKSDLQWARNLRRFLDVMSVEALIRWRHPRRGTLPPDAFIPLAEETGLIVPLGLWAVREAASQLRRWRDHAQVGGDVAMSINLSPRHFLEPDLVAQVSGILDEEGVGADRVMIEVTETALMQDPDAAVRKVTGLRDLGVRVCLDDFGTGYSSLGHLRRFALDTLKVDRSFVGRLDRSARDLALVESITGLARTLGINSIVEGVETAGQLARVRALQPREVQGFLFARPLPPDDAAAFGRTAVADLVPAPAVASTGLRAWVDALRSRARRPRG